MSARQLGSLSGAAIGLVLLGAAGWLLRGAQDGVVFGILGALAGGIAGAALTQRLQARVRDDLEAATRALGALARGERPERLYLAQEDRSGVAGRFNQELTRLSDTLSALQLDRARFQAIIENLQSGVVLLDRRRRVQVVNPAAERIFGVWAPEVVETYHLAITHAYALESALDRVEQGEVLQIERREDGRVLQIDLAPVRGAGGVLLVATDVTEERRLLEVRSQFVANVSHELRTPLTVIGGFAETLLGGGVDEQRRERFLRHINDETKRLTLLVDDLLRLAALESGRERPARAQVPLGEVARAVAERYGESAQARGIQVDVLGEELSVRSDRDRIEGIVISLIDNAVKYTQDDGHIRVETGREDGKVWLRVSDDGPGIPEEDLPRIFERFYRVDRSRQRATGGSGLGLSIARHLALSIGAELNVESTLGKGSTFTLAFSDMAGPKPA
ncbi:MAG: ATP-binding protein [Thermaerobacter sp.]|nr:ATP-binding protein [Thermaerobacter sp.]